ncbi:MAG: UDP-3-O-(3-hydroxymyristoyl)glucosamine N-acyltransferase [Halobacteriovoraceae bacterium]|nr:UDP-3-O-(3-hydroxymyristoyl)glucosamine N-acyltransferase [Halobacteriovoraceae bacterium]
MLNLSELISSCESILVSKTSSIEEVFVSGISTLDDPEEKTILFLKDKKFFSKFLERIDTLKSLNLTLVIKDKLFEECQDDHFALKKFTVTLTASIERSMHEASKFFFDRRESSRQALVDGRQLGTTSIHPTAEISQNVFIGEHVQIGKNVRVMPGCTIMPNVEIGDNSCLFPSVTIYSDVKIGNDVTIHSGTRIGTDGFGYVQLDGEHKKLFHLGNVVIEDEVEIGANCTIDRGTFGPTIIGVGSKLDNMVHMAHNCKVGKKAIICGQTGLAGSVEIGDGVMLSGQVSVAPGLVIESGAQVGGSATVTGNLEGNNIYSGYPARPLREWLRSQATLRKLMKK